MPPHHLDVSASVLGDPIEFGPEHPDEPRFASLPSSFVASVRYDDSPLVMRLRCEFNGERIAVEEVTVARQDGQGVTPRDLVSLELGAAVRAAAEGVYDGRGANVARDGRHAEELLLLADVVWFHHVSWGAPAQAVAGLWGVTRQTAHRWMRRARELYPMPPARVSARVAQDPDLTGTENLIEDQGVRRGVGGEAS